MADFVLIQGLWLRPQVWADVERELVALGHRARAVDLPIGTDATLDDQVEAVLAAVDAADDPVVVGHSAAASLAWIAVDRRALTRVVLIGGFPTADGEVYASFLPSTGAPIPFLGWEQFEGPDSADLDAPTRARMASAMVAVPDGVAQGTVRLANERRYRTPVTLICPEFSPNDARDWIASGDLPELAKAEQLTFVDLDSGHWPMVSQPRALAEALAAAAG